MELSILAPIRNYSCFLHSFTKFPATSPRNHFKIFCGQKECESDKPQGFSALSSDVPWENGSLWSTMGAYFFGLHVPLSFGGLSIVAHLLHQPTLDPLTEAVSLACILTTELLFTLALLRYTSRNQQFKLYDFFFGKDVQERSWILAAAVGFAVLISVVILSSLLADLLVGPKDVNDPIVKEILSSGLASKFAVFLVYCFITPLLEETVYRGFLLTSLASIMEWRQAVTISAFIFSAAHLSIENSAIVFYWMHFGLYLLLEWQTFIFFCRSCPLQCCAPAINNIVMKASSSNFYNLLSDQTFHLAWRRFVWNKNLTAQAHGAK